MRWAALLALASIFVVSGADASAADANAPARRARAISLVSATIASVASDPVGQGLYVEITETDLLYNAQVAFGKPRGAHVGRDTALVTRHDHREWMSVLARLPDGALRARGEVRLRRGDGVLQIVGGSGLYRNARGTLTIRNLRARGLSLNTYRLVR